MPTLDFDGVALQFEDEGSGEPVVLVHGFPFSADLWTPQRAALSATYRVITPNLRGFGGSDPHFGTPSLDVYADDIIAILDELGVAEATVVGLSMGGYIAMALLRRRPDRVRGLALVSTKATADTETAKQGRNDLIALVERDGPAAVADKLLPNMLTERTRTENPELTLFVREMMASSTTEGIATAAMALRDRPDSMDTLATATVPALILVGRDDTVTTINDAHMMNQAIAGSRLVVIPDAAHLVNLEQPAEVDRALLNFLDETTDGGRPTTDH